MSEWPIVQGIMDFVVESNRIEGITRDPTPDEIAIHNKLMCQEHLIPQDIVDFVAVMQPDAKFRDSPSVPGVQVGHHVAPMSGAHMWDALEAVLAEEDIVIQHHSYLHLHPFTDGNGRSARLIWLWRMWNLPNAAGLHAIKRGFLHSFYYQVLEHMD